MLARFDKAKNFAHQHNLLQVTFSNPLSTLLDTRTRL